MPLISSMSRPLVDAPRNVLLRIESAAQALDVAMQASGAKAAYVAACIGKSEGYVSRLRNGKRAIPDKLVKPLCMATGTNLLRQWIDWQDSIDDTREATNARLAALLSQAAA